MKDYTETTEFKKEIENMKSSGCSKEIIEEYTRLMRNFDFFGNDKGTDYSKVNLAYSVDGYTMRNGMMIKVS